MTTALQSTIYFMKEDPLHLTEKPYELDFEPLDGQPDTNMTMNQVDNIPVFDIRSSQDQYSFQKNGFEIMRIDSKMSRNDYNDRKKLIEIYFSEVADILKKNLGAERVQIFDYMVRKRHKQFPICTGGFYEYKQPSSIAHVDTTPRQTRQIIQRINPEDGQMLLQQRHQYVNVWKPLRGPVKDWPLALCDPNTVDKKDYVARDFVEIDSYLETYHLYQKESHDWYYISSQAENEAWVFLQSDSEPDALMGVPHCSFQLNQGQHSDQLPRESIEVRALVFYGST